MLKFVVVVLSAFGSISNLILQDYTALVWSLACFGTALNLE